MTATVSRMSGTPCALVVTGDLDLAGTWMASLRAAGYTTLGCVGPLRSLECPRARGNPCPLAGVADLVVIDPRADPDGRCAGHGTPTLRLRGRSTESADRRTLLLLLTITGIEGDTVGARTEGPFGAEANDRRQIVLRGGG